MKLSSLISIVGLVISLGGAAMAQDFSDLGQTKAEQKAAMIKIMESEIDEMMREQEQIGYLNVNSEGRLSAAGQLIEIATHTLAEAKSTSAEELQKIDEFLTVISQLHDEVHAMALQSQ